MATSSYRMIVLTIFLDIMLIFMAIFSTGAGIGLAQESFGSQVNMYSGTSTDGINRMNPETIDNSQLQLDNSFGDGRASGKAIWELMGKRIAIDKFGSCLGEDCTYTHVWWLVTAFWFFITLINLIMFVELYFIFINKKYS